MIDLDNLINKLLCEQAMNLESTFKEFLVRHSGAVDIDSLPEAQFPKGKGDFFLEEKRSIIEVKSISTDRADALEPWLQKRVENSSEVKDGMPVVFGAASFEQIYEGHSNRALFNKQLDSLAARTLEDYIRSSKKQIYATKNALDCKDAYGFLVILNEGFKFYETWFVYRVMQAMLQRIATETPHLKIDGVWYINESTKNIKGIDVVFIHESEELDDLLPNEILDQLARNWASYRGYIST